MTDLTIAANLFFFNDTATTEIYTLSLHDALPICLRVDVDGVAAFLPGSQVDVRPIRNLESLRGQEIEAKVIKLNRKRSNVVLSRKAILEEENQGKKGETLNALEEGIIVEGQIKDRT